MAASVSILRITGAFAGQSTTDITGANTVANAQDTHEATATLSSNPVRIPSIGSNYSYWVTTRLYAATAPTGTINNIRWYTGGSDNFGTGVSTIGQQATTYVQATGTAGTSGNLLTTTGHTGLIGAPYMPFTYIQTTPLSITGSITYGASFPAQFGNYFVYQLAVASTASPGATGQLTFTWLYDET